MATQKITPAPLTRPLHVIADEIGRDWPRVLDAGIESGFGRIGQHPANPYWSAMRTLSTLDDSVGWDDARRIVLTFLSNAGQWKGETARRVKDELRAALLHHDIERHEPSDLPPAGPSRTAARRAANRQRQAYDPLLNPRGTRF